MTILLTAAISAAVLMAVFVVGVEGFGSAATIAVVDSSGIVCGIVAGAKRRSILCASVGEQPFSVLPDFSFDSVAGGRDFFCGLRSGGLSFFCWSAVNFSSVVVSAKRVYKGPFALTELNVGDNQVCALEKNGDRVMWWRGEGRFPSIVDGEYKSLTSGRGFSCGIGISEQVKCWGGRGASIERGFANVSMKNIIAGDSHVCGISASGVLICEGSNSSGQLNAPAGDPYEFSGLALGRNHSCAIKQTEGTVFCWGGVHGGGIYSPVVGTELESIVAGGDLTCGLITENFTVLCWNTNDFNSSVAILSQSKILPGICVTDRNSCECGIFPDSESLCSSSGIICKFCGAPIIHSVPPSPPNSSPSTKTSKRWVVFAIIGAVGSFAGFCTVLYCIWTCALSHKKVHNSVQPAINEYLAAADSIDHFSMTIQTPFTSPSVSRSRIFRRHGSRITRSQRSGPSSLNDRSELFSFTELATATKNFSRESKLGAGSFGTVYKGKLSDGREVAIKRSESNQKPNKVKEKENAFQSELAFLSRLHHKHLVGFVGYCQEKEERLLVYEYMKNGALYDHLHTRTAETGLLNSWGLRIKVLLDSSRGIEYLHSYAVPPIIHRDIKSSNILLDGEWVARVSDFGLSLSGTEIDGGPLAMRAGTMGYMDPEYYGLQHLTTKSDVYGFGVVMLEVLTGRRAIFREGVEGEPVSVVDYAGPSIVSGELWPVLDLRVAPPGPQEAEAVELVAYTAMHCVSLEGKDRPAMADVVMNLESALALCQASGHVTDSSSVSLASIEA